MPPSRKKARVSQASTPQPKGTAENTPAPTDTSSEKPDVMNDPWTDDETIMLFKCMMRWKPTGLHKHLNVTAIANALSSHGFTAEHTRIPGIWAKLHSLYNLEACDERELNYMGIYTHSPSTSPEAEGAEDNEGAWDTNFSLPEDEFGELMWTRRFDNERGHEILVPHRAQDTDSGFRSDRAASSPPAIEGLNTMEDWRLSTSEREGLRETLGQLEDGEDQDEEEENNSVKDKGKKTATSRAAKGKSARSARSTPADEAEEEDDEEEEQIKAKSKRKRRRSRDGSTSLSDPPTSPSPESKDAPKRKTTTKRKPLSKTERTPKKSPDSAPNNSSSPWMGERHSMKDKKRFSLNSR